MRAAAQKAGLEIETDSCGTAAYHVGNPPDPRSIETAARYGTDISDLRGRQLSDDDFTRFTHIFAMDHENLRNILKRAPHDTSAQICLLMDVVEGREGNAIADPYYGGDEGFEASWADVSAAAKALVAQLS